jgi:hypothetical protein
MVMTPLADLYELDFASKVIDDLLIFSLVPPFDRDVVFPSGIDDPKWRVFSRQFVDLRIPSLFLRGKVDVPFERRRFDLQAEPLVEEFNEPVQAMIRCVITTIDKRIPTINTLNLRVIVGQLGDVRIVGPDVGANGSYVCSIRFRIPLM